MKPSGAGRILLWRGGSLWIGRSGEPTEFHSHHAIQISFPFSEGEVRFQRPGESWVSYRAAIIAPNQPHAFEARGESVVMLFVEPESQNGRALRQLCADGGISQASLKPAQSEIQSLVAAFQQAASDEELVACARCVITRLVAANTLPVTTLDHRIDRAVELLRQRINEPFLLQDIAKAVYLSPDRFRHLFMEQTGMRFRPYVLWLRLETALAELVAKRSVTEAAHAGGFADSAHFSRTFRRMFGIAPSSFQLD